jgi:plastocyanin
MIERFFEERNGPDMGDSKFSRVKIFTAVAAILLVTVVMASCGEETTIVITDLEFDPAEVTIKAGETVTWKNEDRRSHQIMSGAPPVMTDDFVSPNLKAGESWSYTFEEPGEYAFHSMTGGVLGWIYVEE